ncbi:MAG: HAMP domain-containing histidine kinase [Clostridium sp.]|nr:HAMP domain-containing histidine kinase [Clostridium sp.]
MNIYDLRRFGVILFLAVSVTVVGFFIYYSNNIVKDLAMQERSRMQIWANATKEIVNLENAGPDGGGAMDLEFLLGIIQDNRTIPVLLTDDEGNIISHRNFDLPEPVDSAAPLYISRANELFLLDKLDHLRNTPNVIHIIIAPDNMQHLYYEDSKLLRRLGYYPYIQLVVMIAFIMIVYFAVSSTKRAEQNKVWVGLSKETAHQLGTPISSLMAWMELLPDEGVGREIVGEMQKDVMRLSTIASRFSKIGSRPNLETTELNHAVSQCTDYMATRISSRITLLCHPAAEPIDVLLCEPLFQWVMENLIKNAVDAMPSGAGSITVTISRPERTLAVVEVADTGKGLSRKNFKNVFNPGFTTKKRGWGLGLTLAKRIIEQYHDGRIFVKSSAPGVGTTFRIELPVAPARPGDDYNPTN